MITIMNREERNMKMVVRLNQYTTEYVSLAKQKEDFCKSHYHDITREAIHSLYLQQSYIDSVVRNIVKTVRYLIEEQVDFDNEVATIIFNYYDPLIKRGLSDLF